MKLRNAALVAAAALLQWPLFYAVWMSFTPGELLEPPVREWSLRWYRELFDDARWTDAIWSSFRVGGLAVLIAAVAGTGLAVAVVQHRFRGVRALSAVALWPLFVPAVVLGMALLPVVRATGVWGMSISVAGAHALWCMPVVFLVTRAAVQDLDPGIAEAARGLGAGPWTVLRRITLVLVRPAIAVGALLAFVLSFNDFMFALFLCTPEIDTLPKVIWPSLRYTLTPVVAAASTVALGVTVAALLACARLMHLVRVVDSLGRTERTSR